LRYLKGLLILACLIWLAGFAYSTFRFNSKFNACERGWREAHAKQDYELRRLYFRCEQIANNDTLLSPLWPVRVMRWNADYMAEAYNTKDK